MKYREEYDAILKVFRKTSKGPSPIVTRRKCSDRKLLATLSNILEHKKGAEIGVRTGKFSKVFLDANPELEMWCIDPWSPVPNYSQERQDKHFEECVQNLKGYKVHLIKKTSMDALDDVPDDLDVLHIDGRHEFDFVVMDLIHYVPKVKKGGLVALHDYHESGVKYAIDAYTRAHGITKWFALKDFQPTVFWINE